MKLIKYKPTTPSKRNLILIDKSNIWNGKPYKKLTIGIKKGNGRNNKGQITSRNKSVGKKKRLRIIDFKRNTNKKIFVKRIEYDPYRSAHIALIENEDKKCSYIIAPNKIQNKYLYSKKKVTLDSGNCMILKNIPIGTYVHNIELKINKGGQIARSAGTSAIIINKLKKYVYLKLRSGEIKKINELCKATIGIVSNINNKNIKLGKAGRSRWLGVKPKVRGVAKNPIDHPHGGGEGKSSGGRHPVTPWGKPTKGYKTRKRK